MIQIYSPGNTNYTNNGNMTLLPESATIRAILGGTWVAEIVHPLDEDGRWRYIEKEAVLKMPSFNGDQLFRIRQVQKTDYEVYCTADPIFYDCRNDCFIQNLEIEEKTAAQAAELLSSGKYSIETNLLATGSATYEGKNLLEALTGSDENAFINRWGGEPIYDNYKVILNAEAGTNNGVEIRYGKNIPQYGMEVDEDMTSVVTRIYPVAYNGVRMSGGGYVDSPIRDNYAITYTQEIVYEGVKAWEDWDADDENDPNIICCKDQAELDAALLKKAQESFEEGIDKPTVTITTDLILLQNTEQYKDIAGLESVSLGDTVFCRNSNIGITVSARVIELEYNAVMKRVESVTLGDYSGTVFDAIASRMEEIDSLDNRLKKVARADGTLIAEKVKGFINGAVTQLTAMYDAADKADHIAILFENMDATSPLYGALAIGTQGLMISKQRNETNDGWIWTSAMTANGLIANIIVTGLLSDSTGSNYWNLDTGEFRLSPTMVKVDEDNTTLEEWAKTEVGDLDRDAVYAKLTEGITNPGIYMQYINEVPYLYVNADMIKTGTIEISTLSNAARQSLLKSTTSKNQYYLSTSTASATGGTWYDSPNSLTWASGRYVWTRIATTKTYADDSVSTTYSTAVYDKQLTSALSVASGASTKADANIKATVSLYYRATSHSAPFISTATSIGTSDSTDNAWEYVVPKPKTGTYFYTCEKYTYGDNSTGFSTVREMSNLSAVAGWCSANDATYINGASIYTGSITADKINVSELSALGATIGGFSISASKIYSGTLGANNSVHISTANMSGTIAGQSLSNLRFTIGANFGVTSTGVLHAKQAVFYGSSDQTQLKLADDFLFQSRDGSGLRINAPNESCELGSSELTFYSKTNFSGSVGQIFFNGSDFSFDCPLDIQDYSIYGLGKNYNTISVVDVASTSGTNAGKVYFGPTSDQASYADTTYLRGPDVRLAATKGAVYLGSSGSTAVTSDENVKDILPISNRYIEFFNHLDPIQYVYKTGHRTHLGFGAQSVENALERAGLTTEDFAGIMIDHDVDFDQDETPLPGQTHFDTFYSLRYEEFITLNTLMIKQLMERVEILEKTIAEP